MGQQQLLLIILGVVIVGVAMAVGITMFQDNAVDQNRTSVQSDLMLLATKAQHFYVKPTSLAGGGRSFVRLDVIGRIAGSAFTNNPNGTYTVKTPGTATQVELRGVGKVLTDDGVSYPTYEALVKSSQVIMTRVN